MDNLITGSKVQEPCSTLSTTNLLYYIIEVWDIIHTEDHGSPSDQIRPKCSPG